MKKVRGERKQLNHIVKKGILERIYHLARGIEHATLQGVVTTTLTRDVVELAELTAMAYRASNSKLYKYEKEKVGL
jgi:hypothetical protein